VTSWVNSIAGIKIHKQRLERGGLNLKLYCRTFILATRQDAKWSFYWILNFGSGKSLPIYDLPTYIKTSHNPMSPPLNIYTRQWTILEFIYLFIQTRNMDIFTNLYRLSKRNTYRTLWVVITVEDQFGQLLF
jgi:hypothetical protein